MPNHIHGILVINSGVGANKYSPQMGANNNLPLHGTSGTSGAIIRGFKKRYILDKSKNWEKDELFKSLPSLNIPSLAPPTV